MSDLENGKKDTVDIPSEIIDNYVNDNIESIYNIEKTNSTPKIVVHEETIKDVAEKYVNNIINEVINDLEKVQDKSEDDTIDENKDEETKSSWCSIM